jgi:predicted phosphodiesterase
MARYGIVSDIHGNLEALLSALAFLDARGVDRILCLGDIVGYNADPEACLRVVEARGILAIAGNHDLIAARALGLDRCSDKAAFALRRTRARISEATRRALLALPRTRIVDDEILLIHGGVADVCQYIRDAGRVEENHALMQRIAPHARICLFGHTHAQALYEVRRGAAVARPIGEAAISLGGGRAFFANPGSIDAARRAGDPSAELAILDLSRRTLSFHRVPYDHGRAERRAADGGYRMRWSDARIQHAARALRGGTRRFWSTLGGFAGKRSGAIEEAGC